MRPGIALRPDYDAAQLWALAKANRDAGQSRRLLALAEIYEGGSRTKAARRRGGQEPSTDYHDWSSSDFRRISTSGDAPQAGTLVRSRIHQAAVLRPP